MLATRVGKSSEVNGMKRESMFWIWFSFFIVGAILLVFAGRVDENIGRGVILASGFCLGVFVCFLLSWLNKVDEERKVELEELIDERVKQVISNGKKGKKEVKD